MALHMTIYNDYPIDDCLQTAQPYIDSGATVHQKFTCQHCKSRQTMETPNVFYRSGHCEKCNGITIITKCNYMLKLGGKGVR